MSASAASETTPYKRHAPYAARELRLAKELVHGADAQLEPAVGREHARLDRERGVLERHAREAALCVERVQPDVV